MNDEQTLYKEKIKSLLIGYSLGIGTGILLFLRAG